MVTEAAAVGWEARVCSPGLIRFMVLLEVVSSLVVLVSISSFIGLLLSSSALELKISSVTFRRVFRATQEKI